MWQSMFVLQTCAVHLNFIQGHIPVLVLDSENQVFHAALSLSAAVVIIFWTKFLYHNTNSNFKIGQARPLSSVDWRNKL